VIYFVSLVVDGALAGAVYALFALALVVVYKAARMINFALGEWAMVSSGLMATGHVLGLGPLGSIGLAGAGVAAAAVAFNRIVLRRLIGRPPISLIMVTIGLGAVMRGAAAVAFAGTSGRIPFSRPLDPIVVHGVPIAAGKLTAAVIAIGIMETLVAGYLDSVLGSGFSSVAPYVLLLLVLFVRPHGLFGRPEVERV
jgi:branched-chain amino acid transport system permease protein